jgi:hypothetical protein
MKKIQLLLLICQFYLATNNIVFSQTYLFSSNKKLKYNAATAEPGSNWYMPGFDDSGWQYDTASIGFGDRFLRTPVDPGTRSLYLRFVFNIADKSTIKAMNFSPNYDDGYIAYLNGKEIARVNVDKTNEFPAFDDLAVRSHENDLLKEYDFLINGVYLDSTLLSSCLVNGENIMAIHVLNDSANGSDLVFIPRLVDVTKNEYNIYELSSRYKRLVEIEPSLLPLVFVNTDEYGIPYQEGLRTIASMGIINNGPGMYNYPTDAFNDYNGLISIELRGQSSRRFPKQSYRFELKDDSEDDISKSLLGLPSENDWILAGPFADRSLIRNKFVYDLGSRLGHYQPRTVFCELILNDQLVGLYTLTENIKRDKNRVDIAKLESDDIDGTAVTGGYIFKYDKDDINARVIVYPNEDDIQPEQLAYFHSFMQGYDSIFNTNKFIDPGFRKYLDDSSLVDYLIINELSKNADAYLYSTYCYKDRTDRDNRVKFGPLWDYDLGFGNTHYQNGHKSTGWQWDEITNYRLGIRRLLQDTELVAFLQNRWNSLRENVLSDAALNGFIDSLVNSVTEQRIRNYEVWPIIDENPWYYNQTYIISNYDQEIEYMKNWLFERTAWIDANMPNIYYPLVIYTTSAPFASLPKVDCQVFPNPFTDHLLLQLNSEYVADIQVEVSNILGQSFFTDNITLIQGYQEINLDDPKISAIPTGVYLFKVYSDNSIINTIKIIKR